MSTKRYFCWFYSTFFTKVYLKSASVLYVFSFLLRFVYLFPGLFSFCSDILKFLLHFCTHTHTHTHTHIYIYCHPQTDCFVLSELFTVARHVGRIKSGSKPVQIYVRHSIRQLTYIYIYIYNDQANKNIYFALLGIDCSLLVSALRLYQEMSLRKIFLNSSLNVGML